MANLLDKAVGFFSPAAGLRRHYQRAALKRAYEAASPRDKWKPRRGGASANADHQADAATVRTKARSLYQNVPYVKAGVDGRIDHIVGTGIVQRTKGRQAEIIDAEHAAWRKVCDADGRLDFDGLIAAAERAAHIDGECLIRLRPRLATDPLPVPLQLQLLEIDWLDSTRNGTVGGNVIINGIEYGALGRVEAYYLWDQHPGDTALIGGLRRQSQRVSASLVIHYFKPERPGQGRGFSGLAGSIARTRDLALYEDAEQARKNLESRLSVLYSGDPALLANPAGDASGTANTAAGDLGDLPSGGITGLPPGSNMQVVEPKAAPGYVDYVKYQIHLIAVGMGSTYELCTGDMTEVNFSSARVRQIDFRRGIEQHQWLNTAPRLLDPLRRAFIDAGVLAGKFSRNYDVEYSMPKWDYVNPAQEVEADISEISMGLSTVSEKLRRRGLNPATVFDELKKDFDTLRSSGVLEVLMTIMGRVKMPATDDSNGKKSPPAKAA